MKKTTIRVILMLTTLTTACVPNGNKESISECSHDEEVFNRVCKLCSKDGAITRGEDKDNVEVTDYLTSNTEHIPMLDLFAIDTVKSECKEETIIFSFDNDTKVILADPLEEELLDEQNYIIPDYMKYANSKGTNSCTEGNCLAWTKDKMAYMIVDGYNLTSLWSYNDTTKEVSLIWYDKQNSSWQNYKAG